MKPWDPFFSDGTPMTIKKIERIGNVWRFEFDPEHFSMTNYIEYVSSARMGLLKLYAQSGNARSARLLALFTKCIMLYKGPYDK